MGVAGGVLVDRQQAGNTAAAHILRTHGVAGALGGDHQDVDVRARLDQLEVDVEAMGEKQGGALLHVPGQAVLVDVRLQFVRRQHHQDVGPGRGLVRGHHGEASTFGLLGRAGAGAQGDADVLDAAVAQVHGVGVALAAITDNADLLVLDQIHIGVAVVENAHDLVPFPLLVRRRGAARAPVS